MKGFQIRFLPANSFRDTLPKTNMVPENRPSQKEIHLPTIHFQVRAVSFREGKLWGGIFCYFFQASNKQINTYVGYVGFRESNSANDANFQPTIHVGLVGPLFERRPSSPFADFGGGIPFFPKPWGFFTWTEKIPPKNREFLEISGIPLVISQKKKVRLVERFQTLHFFCFGRCCKKSD